MWGETWGQMIWGSSIPVPLLSPIGLAVLAASFLSGAWVLRNRASSRHAATIAVTVALLAPWLANAAFNLPNTFVNGTVADADEVNANFGSITEDFTKYQLILDASTAGTSVPVPANVLDTLCRDGDGCTLRLISRDIGGIGSQPWVLAPALFDYQTTAIVPSIFGWSSSIVAGEDGDNNPQGIINTGDNGCYFHDGEFVSFSGSDAVVGINMLVGGGTGHPDRKCSFTITD